MLTGLYPPTSGTVTKNLNRYLKFVGTAFVAGYDITKDLDRVHQYLGGM